MIVLGIIIALVLAFLAFKFVKGMIKFAVLAVALIIVVGGIYFLSNFQVHG
jgi:hypothetical protein